MRIGCWLNKESVVYHLWKGIFVFNICVIYTLSRNACPTIYKFYIQPMRTKVCCIQQIGRTWGLQGQYQYDTRCEMSQFHIIDHWKQGGDYVNSWCTLKSGIGVPTISAPNQNNRDSCLWVLSVQSDQARSSSISFKKGLIPFHTRISNFPRPCNKKVRYLLLPALWSFEMWSFPSVCQISWLISPSMPHPRL